MRNRTGFSFRYAYGFTGDVLDRVTTPYAAITDRASTFGYHPWKRECERRGIKPIYGVELAVTESPNDKKPSRVYVTLIPKSNLLEMNKAFAMATAQFRYEPLLTYNDLNSLSDDVHIIFGRDINPELLRKDREYFVAHGPSTPARMMGLAEAHPNWRLIASSDNVYPAPEDQHAYRILLGRNANVQTWDQHICSDDELRACGVQQEAFDARDEVAASCNIDLPMANTFAPPGVPTVEDWCASGAEKLGVDLTDPVYAERLERELGVINTKGYQGYFQIIADLCTFARKKMFVGPGRGSACGSLVCYLMEITSVDPIKHDLLFERFLDIGRTDLPDIDMDFSDERRELVFHYLKDRYGSDHVCRLGTIAFYRSRSLVKEIVPLFNMNPFRFEAVIAETESVANKTNMSKTLEGSTIGQQILREEPGLRVLSKLDGHPRHMSTHASGIVVTEDPVANYLAVDSRSDTSLIDRLDSEQQNILKIDVLGLRQLSVFEDCLELIGKSRNWLENAPLDDQEAFNVLNRGEFSGVFQFNGHALQSLAKGFHIDDFEDMVAITALARPGPMGSGGADKWVRIRNGDEPVTFRHPAFEPILGATRGIVLYQEQVMMAGLKIGDMDWSTVTKLRKVVQYFTGRDEMNKFREQFMKGALDKGIEEKDASEFWDELLAYGSYAFNRAHAVAYSMISYWCCYLKAHHPVEYAAAMLNHEREPSRQLIMLREMEAEGIDYTPVDKDHSTMKWQVAGGRLIGPITLCKGLGQKTAQAYINARDAGLEPPKRALSLLEKPTTPLDDLRPISGAIRRNHPDLTAINIFSTPERTCDLGEDKRQGVLVAGLLKMAKSRPDEKWGGNKMTGVIEDDYGDVRFFISSKKFERMAKKMLDAGRVGETLWAVKGTLADGGGMIFADNVRFLGTTK